MFKKSLIYYLLCDIPSYVLSWHHAMAEIHKKKVSNRRSNMHTIAGLVLSIFVLSNFAWSKDKLPQPCNLLELSSIGFTTSEKTRAAWSINDMTFFENKLYIGHGDAVVNTGPTDVICFDFNSDEFVTEFTVDDEAIYLYQIVNNRLMIPGVDATEDWTFGNFYILEDSGWIKHRTIPNGIHVNYLTWYNEELFASAGTFGKIGEDIEYYVGGIFCSADKGKTWSLSYATPADDRNVYRVNPLVVYKNKLYAFPFAYSGLAIEEIPEKYHEGLSEKPHAEGHYLILTEDIFGPCDVITYDGARWCCQDIIPYDKLCYISKPFVFKDKLIIPALFGEYIDYLNKDRELTVQAEIMLLSFNGKNTKAIKFNYDKLIDVLTKENTLYLLIKLNDLHFIARTENAKNWKYHLIPPIIQEPRSIEFADGKFYVGTGDGNIFESLSSKPIKELAETENFVPNKIFGAAELPEDGKWYWVAITKWQDPDKLAKISAEVKFGNVIKVSTDNISKMSISLPFYHLDLNHEIIVIIDDNLVYEGRINDTKELICTREEKNGEAGWQIEKGIYSFDEYKIMK